MNGRGFSTLLCLNNGGCHVGVGSDRSPKDAATMQTNKLNVAFAGRMPFNVEQLRSNMKPLVVPHGTRMAE